MIILQTQHPTNIKITHHFANGSGGKKLNISDYKFKEKDVIASYGILRGTGEIFRQSKDFFYIDHGYLGASKRSFNKGATVIQDLEGYFRVVHNEYIGFELKKYDSKRLEKLNIEFKQIRTSGEYIILSEPSIHIKNFFNLNNWVEKTIYKIKQHTDRKIFLHNKSSPIPLDILLEKAWAFVSFQSTAGFKAMTKGVPAHFTYNNLKNINSLENIENGKIEIDLFTSLSYNQWTLREFDSGEAWEQITKFK
jgi:hypothetical protein